jgi:hypothetical protein
VPDRDHGSEISPETLALAAEAEREAARLPSAAEIRALAAQAVRHGGPPGMSSEEVRRLADQAVQKAEEMTALLRQVRDMIHADAHAAEARGD